MDPEDPDIGDIAQKEAFSGYGGAALSPGLTPPIPMRQASAMPTDDQVLQAIGKDRMYMWSNEWGPAAAQYRAQYADNEAKQSMAMAQQYKAMLDFAGKQQTRQDKIAVDQAKALDPFLRAQRAYAQAGSLGGARTIAKSTGAALFQHGEIVELGSDLAFRVQPIGAVRRVSRAGKEETIGLSQYLAEEGIGVVPFLGGDEDAKSFRRMVAMTHDLISKLEHIEKIASSPGAHTLYATDSRSMLKQLEGGLEGAVNQIRSGSKSMAGTSDKEMEALADSVPKASDLFRRDKDALIKADMTKRQILNIVIRQARANGIELNLMDLKKKAGPNASQGGSMSNQPPGTNNGKQSGTSVTAQPR